MSTTADHNPPSKSWTKKLMITLGIILAVVAMLAVALPTILHKAGLHPAYADSKDYQLDGKKALIITTSHGVLNKPGETDGKPTGVFGSEMTVPYYEFSKAGMQVDLASIKGGEIPVDPQSFLYIIATPEDKRYQKDAEFQAKTKNSLKIDDVDFTQYDIIFLAGGWGPAYDFAPSEVLGQKISEAYYAQKTPIIGGICHGPLGLIQAKDKDGGLLIAGRRMTGVSDKQIKELGIGYTPYHPETELRKAGVDYQSNSKFRDAFADLTVVDDEKRFVTGQNQNAGHETAQKMMALIAEGK